MSKTRNETITCPACGYAQNFLIWDSVNSGLDPQAKQRLIDGSLFTFKCEKCGNTTSVNYNVLFNDTEHNMMVYYVQPEMVNDTIQMFLNMNNFAGGVLADKRYRIVTNINSLREKAIILDNGLDDRIIEIIKLLYYYNLSNENPGKSIHNIYFRTENGNFILDFIGDLYFSITITSDFYNDIKNRYSEAINVFNSNDYIVDGNWASELFRKLNDN